jgi:hypothetical protein
MLEIPFGYRVFFLWGEHGSYGQTIRCFNRDDLNICLAKFNGIYNCGISVCTWYAGNPYLLYMVFDFDDKKDLEKPKIEAIKTYNFFASSGYDVQINFSGQKGFHVLVATMPKPYTKQQLKNANVFFKKHLKLDTVDTRLFGDVVRKIRIPNTIHANSRNFSCVISHQPGELFDLDDFFDGVYDTPSIDDLQENENGNSYSACLLHDYPCLDMLISNRNAWLDKFSNEETFEPFWEIRFTWVIKELMKGRTIKDIYHEIESFGWDDFDPDKTLYHIERLANKNYKPISRKRFMEMGICLGDECPAISNWKI